MAGLHETDLSVESVSALKYAFGDRYEEEVLLGDLYEDMERVVEVTGMDADEVARRTADLGQIGVRYGRLPLQERARVEAADEYEPQNDVRAVVRNADRFLEANQLGLDLVWQWSGDGNEHMLLEPLRRGLEEDGAKVPSVFGDVEYEPTLDRVVKAELGLSGEVFRKLEVAFNNGEMWNKGTFDVALTHLKRVVEVTGKSADEVGEKMAVMGELGELYGASAFGLIADSENIYRAVSDGDRFLAANKLYRGVV